MDVLFHFYTIGHTTLRYEKRRRTEEGLVQLKEGKRDKLAELREQFEADKKKIEKLKQTVSR